MVRRNPQGIRANGPHAQADRISGMVLVDATRAERNEPSALLIFRLFRLLLSSEARQYESTLTKLAPVGFTVYSRNDQEVAISGAKG